MKITTNREMRRKLGNSAKSLRDVLENAIENRKRFRMAPNSTMLHIESRMGQPDLSREDLEVMWNAYLLEIELAVEREQMSNSELR